MNLTNYEHYQDFLSDVYKERRRRNERYSLRSFARSLDLSPAMLTAVLNRRKGLSLQSAIQISERLELSDLDGAYFCDLVNAMHARSKTDRELSSRRINVMKRIGNSEARANDGNHEVLKEEELEFIRHWSHIVILEYVNMKGRVSDLSQLAADLNLSIHTVREGIERLVRLGLLTKKDDHDYLSSGKKFSTSRDIPSQVLREAHEQFLDLARKALFSQPVLKRDFSVGVVPTTHDKIAEVKRRIHEFRRETTAFLQDTGEPNTVYSLNIQLFSLIHSSSETTKQ